MTAPKPLRVFSDAFEVVAEARAYSYETSGSFAAAHELLRGVDEDDARVIAALLAALIAMDLRPAEGQPLLEWLRSWCAAIAAQEAKS